VSIKGLFTCLSDPKVGEPPWLIAEGLCARLLTSPSGTPKMATP